jgi:hypothetical protein
MTKSHRKQNVNTSLQPDGRNQQSEQSMKSKVPIKQQPVQARTQPPDIQRRINAGSLRLWRNAHPNTPPRGKGRRLNAKRRSPSRLRSAATEDGTRPAAVDYLTSLLCASLALVLLATGCVGPRPLKGGRAVTAHKPAGVIEQTLVQGENPAQATRQTQETVKVRTYTVPAGSRVEQSQMPPAAPPQRSTLNTQPINVPPSTLNSQPSTTFLLSAPMPVVEREETRAGTELGAAQKDTARELGAKLSSLKGIVWVGVALFLFGLASLVYPPLKLIVASVTTSAALMFGGLALMVLPSLVVGNELLILGAVALAVGGWFIAHRHGQLRGIVAASTGTSTGNPPAGPQQSAS